MRIVLTALSTLLPIVILHFPAVAGPIHDAAKIGDAVQVESLIAEGTPVDEKDALDKTALLWASENGHTDVAQFLVRKGRAVLGLRMPTATELSIIPWLVMEVADANQCKAAQNLIY